MYNRGKNMSNNQKSDNEITSISGGKGIVLFNVKCASCGCVKTITKKPSTFLCEKCGSNGFEYNEYPLHPTF